MAATAAKSARRPRSSARRAPSGAARRGQETPRAIELAGSCQCGKVRFTVQSETPYPFMYCYCSICRKTEGSFGCNIMGVRDTLRVTGKANLRVHHAVMRKRGRPDTRSEGERWFCVRCGTHLYLLDDRWPEGVWPSAAAIDTPLPIPPSQVHLMLKHKPAWVPVPGRGARFPEYPELSIAEWHRRHGLSGATAARDTPAARRPR